MSVKITTTCDVCGREIDPINSDYGVIKVTSGNGLIFDLCSPKCVKRWAETQPTWPRKTRAIGIRQKRA